MSTSLRSLWGRSAAAPAVDAPALPPRPATEVVVDGLPPFPLAQHLRDDGGFPALDWHAVVAWAATASDEAAGLRGWAACGRAWLEHLGASLGAQYRVDDGERSQLLSSLPPAQARSTLAFMDRTAPRIVRLLEGVADVPPWGRAVLVVFDDADTYYRCVAREYPDDDGEFGFSSGMYLRDGGFAHFVTVKAEAPAMEAVIAHEMTHACLGHLALPAWLNEGLAVNTERRLTPPPPPTLTPHQVHRMHARHWNGDTIQAFWSGESFVRGDEGQMLSYELAATLVEQLARDWPAFRSFACDASRDDAGAAAARRHVGMDLGAAVCALVEHEGDPAWSPDPERWTAPPEPGGLT